MSHFDDDLFVSVDGQSLKNRSVTKKRENV